MSNNSRRLLPCAASLALCLALFACAKQPGSFGFKHYLEDSYRTASRMPEFPADAKYQWSYVFNQPAPQYKVGVILQKKELVWVEVNSRALVPDPSQPVIYGDIEGLEPGEYEIVLTEVGKSKLIDHCFFRVYRDDDEE